MEMKLEFVYLNIGLITLVYSLQASVDPVINTMAEFAITESVPVVEAAMAEQVKLALQSYPLLTHTHNDHI